ncbi:hypothetical protein I4U23_011762 [Adineta vaga]|nr:hypothetical protein I4U23_011762 [Adineta vaga]
MISRCTDSDELQHYLRLSNATGESCRMLPPIQGYAKEPLKPYQKMFPDHLVLLQTLLQQREHEEFATPGIYKELWCEGRSCARCGKCRDWYYTDSESWQWVRNHRNWNSNDLRNVINSLLKLKCFSLNVFLPTTEFDDHIVPFVRRMSHLESLTLSLGIRRRTSFIDGTYLYNNIFKQMPHLRVFNCDLITDFVRIDGHVKPSADDIRCTFDQIGYHVNCYIDCNYNSSNRCHIHSIPFRMDRMHHITHNFSGGTFMTVRVLSLVDNDHPFEYQFFGIIARSFPLLTRLTIRNTIGQKEKRYNELMKFEDQYQIIEYSHLVELDCAHVHIDYVEQFVSQSNTNLPYREKSSFERQMTEEKLEVNLKNAPTIVGKFDKAMKEFMEAEIKSMTTTLSPKSADTRETNDCYIQDKTKKIMVRIS